MRADSSRMNGLKISQRVGKLAEYVALHPWRILGLALLLSIAAGWAAAQLPVYTSRQALLPQNTAVAKRFNDFLKNFGAAARFDCGFGGCAPEASWRPLPTNWPAKLQIRAGDRTSHRPLDIGFFLEHAYLLMPAEGLDQLAALPNQALSGGLEENLRKALDWSKNHPPLGEMDTDLKTAEERLNLAGVFLDEWQRWLSAETAPVALDWSGLLAKTGAAVWPSGNFASRDGRMLFVFVHPKNPSEDFQNLGPFVDKVKQVSAELGRTGQGRRPYTAHGRPDRLAGHGVRRIRQYPQRHHAGGLHLGLA